MDWSMIGEIGTVGVLTLLIVQLGKSVFPNAFRADTNVSWSVGVAIVLQAIYARLTGGSWLDVWNAVPQGAMMGYTVSGIYRQISSASKARSVDMTEQIHETIVTTPEAIKAMIDEAGDDDEKAPIGFTK